VEAKISGERISSFLGEGRASDYRVVKTRAERRPANGAAVSSSDPDSAPAAEIAIEISEGTFRWDVPPPSILWTAEDKGQKFGSRANLKKLQERKAEMRALRSMTADQTTATPPVLQSINLTVNQGDLVFLLGQVGSGKTALLHTILGEMVLANGRVEVTGSLSYQAQSAFILNATVKENILFGSPYDADRYLSVVRGCALVPDLQTLPSGDTTEIGERGVNLSGGQKQRLGLARAVLCTGRPIYSCWTIR
jgi:ABC-type multidrug transport system fused ATPase/permease subunit